MKQSYPIILIPDTDGSFVVDVPDFTISTEGTDITNAIEMARDAISLTGVSMEDRGLPLPEPTPLKSVEVEDSADVVTLVDVDFFAYRKQWEKRTVRKNCTLPSWLNTEAEKAGLNFSALLQAAVKAELNIT